MQPFPHNFDKMIQSSGNLLLLKCEIGKRRPVLSDLPPDTFIYGRRSSDDLEGAGQLISSWKLHHPSKTRRGETNFKSLNSLSVINNLSTLSQFSDFRKNAKGFCKLKASRNNSQPLLPDIRFGMPIIKSTSIKDLMTYEFGRQETIEKHKVYGEILKEKMKNCKKDKVEPESFKGPQAKRLGLFKLKKFEKITPRTSTWRDSHTNK